MPARQPPAVRSRCGAPRRLTGILAGLVAVLVVTAAGCGSSPSARASTPPKQLVTSALQGLGRAKSVRIVGSVKVLNGGKVVSSVGVDATSVAPAGGGGASGGTASGTLTLTGSLASSGQGFVGTVGFRIVDGRVYVKGDRTFWRSFFYNAQQQATFDAKVVPKLIGHWVRLVTSSTSAFVSDSAGTAQPQQFAGDYLATMKGTLTNLGDQTLDGVSGVQVSSKLGGNTLVASSGPVLPLVLSASHASGADSLSLALRLSYPVAAPVSAPPGALYITNVIKPYEHGG